MTSAATHKAKIGLSGFVHRINRFRISLYAVFFVSCLFLGFLEHQFRSQAYSGLYFQNHTSDEMMQTLPVTMLKSQPLNSLLYLHIQPPMLDSIRTFLVFLAPSNQSESLLRFVDRGLYFTWLLLFGFLNVLIFAWVAKITKSITAGTVAAIIWIFHPAAILYATKLDGTFLSTFLITWMVYEIWLLSIDEGSAVRLGVVSSLSFLTRTVFQWYFAPVLGLSLILLPIKKQKKILALSIFCVIVFIFCGKQFLLFRTLSTTTYGGYHKTGIIWHKPDKDEIEKYLAQVRVKYPEEARKIRDPNNNEITWKHNLIHNAIFSDKLKENFSQHLKKILISFRYNFNYFWQPSTYNDDHLIIPKLSWRNGYDWVFSKWRLWTLLIISLVIWLFLGKKQGHQRIRRFLSLLIVISYILMITHLSNRLQWSEAGRLKFFLEPAFLVFIISQLSLLIRSIINSRFGSKIKWPLIKPR